MVVEKKSYALIADKKGELFGNCFTITGRAGKRERERVCTYTQA